MSIKALSSDLESKNLRQIYLFHGPERYLRRQFRQRLKQALMGDDANVSMNYHYFEGNDTSVSELIDLADTLPFLAERRLIIWENSGLFKKSDDTMVDYLKNLPPTTSFLFVEAEVDKRSRMFKTISAAGGVVEFQTQDEDVLRRWITGILRKEGRQVSGGAVDLILAKCGSDMDNIYNELEKLICYSEGRDSISIDDIEEVTTTRIGNKIFDMVGAVADKKAAQALALYGDLLALREPAMRILFLIGRQFGHLLQVKDLKSRGYDNKTIGAKAGLPPFVVAKHAAQAAKFTDGELRSALNVCVEADEAVKTGRMGDKMSVELLIVELSALA